MNRIDLEGRAAVVTGGATGIGLAVARRLADSGARVALWDLDGAEAARAASGLTVVGDGHVGIGVDEPFHDAPDGFSLTANDVCCVHKEQLQPLTHDGMVVDNENAGRFGAVLAHERSA